MSESSAKVIPVTAEEVTLDKRQVETGRVRVRTRVDTYEDWVRETLQRQDVEIERIAVNQPVDPQAPPQIREEEEGAVTIIPVLREELAIEKRLVLAEEIHLRRRVGAETVEQPVTLRRHSVEISRLEPETPAERTGPA